MQSRFLLLDTVIFIILIYINLISAYGQAEQPSIHIIQGSSSPSNFGFYSQPFIEVGRGTKISWINDDSVDHTVTFVDTTNTEKINQVDDIVKPSHSITYQFNVPGVYDYYCKIYPFMTGRVSVK
jgi:plastocyanin